MKLYGRKATKPLKAIRLFCFECMGMSRSDKKPKVPVEDVKGCTDDLCPLFDFRLGKNPYLRKTEGNPEALRNARETRLRAGGKGQISMISA
jgi:hypothetical protein